MSRLRFALLVAAALSFALGAGALENHPDCEAGQVNRAEGAPFTICEGEHWDGQDPNSQNGNGNTADFDGESVWVGVGSQSANPNPPEPLNPLFVRASVQFAGDEQGVYTSQGLHAVGDQAAYVGTGGEVAWYGRDNTDQIRDPTTGDPLFAQVIGPINTDAEEGGADGNIIAWIVGFEAELLPVPIAAFDTGEGDCSQPEYEASDCQRDNTAATVDLIP